MEHQDLLKETLSPHRLRGLAANGRALGVVSSRFSFPRDV